MPGGYASRGRSFDHPLLTTVRYQAADWDGHVPGEWNSSLDRPGIAKSAD